MFSHNGSHDGNEEKQGETRPPIGVSIYATGIGGGANLTPGGGLGMIGTTSGVINRTSLSTTTPRVEGGSTGTSGTTTSVTSVRRQLDVSEGDQGTGTGTGTGTDEVMVVKENEQSQVRVVELASEEVSEVSEEGTSLDVSVASISEYSPEAGHGNGHGHRYGESDIKFAFEQGLDQGLVESKIVGLDFERINKENEDLEKENRELKRILKEFEGTFAKAMTTRDNEIHRLQGKLEGVRNDAVMVEEEQRNTEMLFGQLSQRYQQVKDVYENAMKNEVALKEAIAQLQSEKKGLESDVFQLEGRVEKLGDHVAELNGKIQEQNTVRIE